MALIEIKKVYCIVGSRSVIVSGNHILSVAHIILLISNVYLLPYLVNLVLLKGNQSRQMWYGNVKLITFTAIFILFPSLEMKTQTNCSSHTFEKKECNIFSCRPHSCRRTVC